MTAQRSLDDRIFAMQFTSSARGVRLARRAIGERIAAWGHPPGSEAHDVLTLIASELCTNAVRHGRVPGRDFQVTLTAAGERIRVAVTDTRTDRRPPLAAPPPPGEGSGPAEHGRGLLLVDRLADRWGVAFREGAPGKTVWADYVRSASAGARVGTAETVHSVS